MLVSEKFANMKKDNAQTYTAGEQIAKGLVDGRLGGCEPSGLARKLSA